MWKGISYGRRERIERDHPSKRAVFGAYSSQDSVTFKYSPPRTFAPGLEIARRTNGVEAKEQFDAINDEIRALVLFPCIRIR